MTSFSPAAFDEDAHGEAPEPVETRKVTEKQARYMADLLNALTVRCGDYGKQTAKSFYAAMEREGYEDIADIPKSKASTLIDWLKQHKATAQSIQQQQPKQEPEPAIEGIHYLDGYVYKVQQSLSSGNLYAKVLVHPQFVVDEDKPTWEYAKGAVYKLSQHTLMTKEDAEKYGQMYGVCAVCGRVLTNEESIERGIGPICYGRL